jgi:hypothetical protein
MYPKLKTIKQKEELAKRMLHSTDQQEKYNLVGEDAEGEEEFVKQNRVDVKDEGFLKMLDLTISRWWNKHLTNVSVPDKYRLSVNKDIFNDADAPKRHQEVADYINKMPVTEYRKKDIPKYIDDWVDKWATAELLRLGKEQYNQVPRYRKFEELYHGQEFNFFKSAVRDAYKEKGLKEQLPEVTEEDMRAWKEFRNTIPFDTWMKDLYLRNTLYNWILKRVEEEGRLREMIRK